MLPTHIGAERIAEIILFPETSRFVRESERMQELDRTLRNIGLSFEVVVVPEKGALTNLTIEEIETRARGAFFIVQLNRRDGDSITDPPKTTRVEPGDGVVLVGRSGQAISAMFATPPEKPIEAQRYAVPGGPKDTTTLKVRGQRAGAGIAAAATAALAEEA